MKATGEWVEENITKNVDIFREGLISMASALVEYKAERFKKNLTKLRKNTNIFDKITQPEDQISTLLKAFSKLVKEAFSLKNEEICITIMEVRDNHININADFIFSTHKNWIHSDANDILKQESAAKHCLETGEVFLIDDKLAYADEGKYFMSDRDKRSINGSIYCYPCFTETPSENVNYIISVVTYGEKICYSGTKLEQDSIKEIFNDICQRIDLELTLKSIKDWKKK